MKENKKYSIFSNVKYIYREACRLNKPMKFWLISNFFSSLLIPLLQTALTSIVVYLLTNGYPLKDYLLGIGLVALGMIMLEGLRVYSFQRYTWENTFVRCGEFWTRLSQRAITCDYDLIEPKDGQKKLYQAFEALDSNWIGIEGMLKETPTMMINACGMVVYMILVGIYCPYVLIPMVGMVAIDLFFAQRADKIIVRDREASNGAYFESAYLASDIGNPNNGKDIRIYQLHKWFARRFDAITVERLQSEKKYHLNSLASELSHTGFDLVRDLIAYLTLILMVINKNIDVATFVFMIGITAGFSTWVNSFSKAAYKLKSDSVQVNCYRHFLDDSQGKVEKSAAVDINSLGECFKIEFRHVSFTYPQTDKEIIHDLSFIIAPGEKIALVGNNGAGKTTIIKLLCGLYTPTSGTILVNDIDINLFDKNDYLQLISAVFQDSQELAFTILENVTCLPVKDANYELFNECIAKAGLSEKLASLPDHELTYLTQNFNPHGIRLSGGELQKLMLARALYKNAPILLLDEPTAALDPINVEKMYMLYQSFSQNNTSLFISHRLASTRFCQSILYLENGRIVEQGSHEELLRLNGKYRAMFDVQAQYYKEGVQNVTN